MRQYHPSVRNTPEEQTDAAFLASEPVRSPSAWQHAVLDEVRRWALTGPVLDAGCNCGVTLCLLARTGLGPLVGIDIDPTAVRKAEVLLRSEGVNAELTTGDITAGLPFPEEHFATVICSEVLEHIPTPRQAVPELVRVTRRGGTIVATTPIRGRSGSQLSPAGRDNRVMRPQEARHFHWSEMTMAGFRAVFRHPDLRVLEHRAFNLRLEGTLSNSPLRSAYGVLHRVRWLSSRLGRNQLIVAVRTTSS